MRLQKVGIRDNWVMCLERATFLSIGLTIPRLRTGEQLIQVNGEQSCQIMRNSVFKGSVIAGWRSSRLMSAMGDAISRISF